MKEQVKEKAQDRLEILDEIAKLEKEVKKNKVKNTTLGWRERTRTISNIETLKVGSSGFKKRVCVVR